jgi:hypothetical protein
VPELQQFTVTIRDDWPNIKLMITAGPQVIATDVKQYDIALPNFEAKIKNVLQQAVDRITRAHIS